MEGKKGKRADLVPWGQERLMGKPVIGCMKGRREGLARPRGGRAPSQGVTTWGRGGEGAGYWRCNTC